MDSPIPEEYPQDLNECLEILSMIRYECVGFPIISLYFEPVEGYWSVMFRNPKNFTNPDIREGTPIGAVHKMFDFLKKLNSID